MLETEDLEELIQLLQSAQRMGFSSQFSSVPVLIELAIDTLLLLANRIEEQDGKMILKLNPEITTGRLRDRDLRPGSNLEKPLGLGESPSTRVQKGTLWSWRSPLVDALGNERILKIRRFKEIKLPDGSADWIRRIVTALVLLKSGTRDVMSLNPARVQPSGEKIPKAKTKAESYWFYRRQKQKRRKQTI